MTKLSSYIAATLLGICYNTLDFFALLRASLMSQNIFKLQKCDVSSCSIVISLLIRDFETFH